MPSASETKAIEFFQRFGLDVHKIPEGSQRTADFAVSCHGSVVLYAECKYHPAQWDYMKGQVCAHDPIYNRVTEDIHDAVKQLNASNPSHSVPNVLVIVNEDCASDDLDLDIVFRGYVDTDEGKRLPIFGKYAWGRIAGEKFDIDLYVWIQSESKGVRTYLRTPGGKFEEDLRRLFEAKIV